MLLNSLAPVWDGNEVWLIIAGGLLFAAFAPVYAMALTGFYLFVMAAVFALILRATAFEFWYQDEKHRRLWEKVFSLSSLLIPLLLGLLAGNAVAGVTLTADFKYTGNWWTVFRPLPVILALTGLAIFFFQGAVYAVGKTEGGLQERLLRLARAAWWLVLGASLVLAILLAYSLPAARGRVRFWLGAGLVAASLVLTGRDIFTSSNRALFAKAALALAGWWLLLAGVQFPNLIRAAGNSPAGLTISNAASPAPVLKILAGFIAAGMLVVLGTTWFVYRVFKGKVKSETGY
jgi:cytochrome d ubiquinol oxidase subunit II